MVNLEHPNLLKKLWNKVSKKETFIFHSQNYCLPPIAFPTVDYTPDPLDLLKSHPDILEIEHFPLDGGIRETYRWYITIKASSRPEIENLLEPYRRIGPKYYVYHNKLEVSIERYKTNGFYFIQMIANASRKNVDLIRQTQLLWSNLSWHWIAENNTAGWISAKGARIRK